MDRADQGKLLTEIGPGTAMGGLMREYWIPALMSSELQADAPPLRLKLLGEELIAFRATSGRVGIFDHRCPHRCTSLFYGRNEEDGLRCVFHGWKFDADGNCVDMPNVESTEEMRREGRAAAYRVTERAGVVWVYMGRRASPPALPEFPVFSLPSERVAVWCEQRECNYLQCVEGEIDTSHAGFLHLGAVGSNSQAGAYGSSIDVTTRAVRYKVTDTDYGMLAGGYRDTPDGRRYWRFANFLFPFWTQPPPCPFGTEAIARAWVPMDDTHTMLFAISTDTFLMSHHANAVLPPAQPGLSFRYKFLPNMSDWHGRWRLAANASNDFLIDREVQRGGSFSGIEGLDIQDAAVQTSMGAIVDRTREHLVASDLAVARTRHRLLAAALAHRDAGTTPPGVDRPDVYRTWSGYLEAPAGQDWLDVFAANLPKADQPARRENAPVRYGN
jgi:phenylpropionate dioxygenase-like ring-hydroxylating dioxygenase large terminal subunit